MNDADNDPGWPHGAWRRLRREPLLLALAALVAILAVVDPRAPAEHAGWLDAPVLAGLLALLAVAQGVRESGLVQRFARRLLRRVHGQRRLVLLLLALSALSAMLLTNDVSLFLLMPLTLALTEQVHLPRQRLVAVQALAVNAGSTLSPVGNPQNLMLWRHAGVSMPQFVLAMAPAVAVLLAVLLATVLLLFPARALQLVTAPPQRTPFDRGLGMLSLALLVAVLALLQCHRADLAALLALAVLGLARRHVLAHLDWPLLATIALMLLGLGHFAGLPAVQHAMQAFDWHDPWTVYAAGIGLSQAVSNVPATVALLHAGAEPLALAVAVNVAGSGLAIGSLASLIALRLEGSGKAWRTFHAISLPYLLVTAVLVWWLVVR